MGKMDAHRPWRVALFEREPRCRSTMKPWGSQASFLHISALVSSGNRERLAGVQGGGNEPPVAARCGEIRGMDAFTCLAVNRNAFGMHSTIRAQARGKYACAGPLIWIRRVAHSLHHSPVTTECHTRIDRQPS